MQNGDATDAGVANQAEPTIPEEITKNSIRQKVWKHLESNSLAMFPRPVYQRIPNFKGAADAADLFAETDLFKNATNFFVNPDKPQEFVRIKCVEHKKCLYVPCSLQQEGYTTRIDPPEGGEVKNVVSRKGMTDYGKVIGIDEKISLDVVVIGSVAVSKQGNRIGNGRGFTDLEFGLLTHMEAIKPSTIVVTVVHDCQVLDSIPAELFSPQDVTVDLIVTNTQVIETQRTHQRRSGILWHLVSSRRLQAVSILSKLRDIEIQSGKPCPLKQVDTDPEDRLIVRVRRNYRTRRSQHRRAPPNNKEGDQGVEEDGEETERKPRARNQRRNSQKLAKEGGDDRRRLRKHKLDIDFSLKLSNITKNTRVRDLKMALMERGVKPNLMIWKGFRGYCYLHFMKNHKKEEPKGEGDATEVSPLTMESIMAALKDMRVREGGAPAGSEGAPPAEGEGETYTVVVEVAPPREPKMVDIAPVVTSEQATAV